MMTATTGSVEENWWPPVKVKPIFVAAAWIAWNELALWVKGCAKALKLAMKLLFELINSAIKARNVPRLAIVQHTFCTRKDVFVPDDMAIARMMMSSRPRPNVHHCPVASLPLTALPALISPLLLVTAPSTASAGPSASTANERAQKAAPMRAEIAAEKLLNTAT